MFTLVNKTMDTMFYEQSLINKMEIAMYNYLLFDLDGTLTDSGAGIINSVLYALKKFDIEVKRPSTIICVYWTAISGVLSNILSFSPEQAFQAVCYYREYFSEKGIFENKVISGIEALLDELNRSGKKLVVATSKPEEYTIKILKHFNLISYFQFVAGATMDETRNSKTAVIAYALEHIGVVSKSEVVMIGDRKHDIEGAKNNHIDSIGVLFGYGDRKELEQAGADYIAENVEELKHLLKN